MEALPDLSTLTDDDLRTMIRELEREEDDISFSRRVLHGRIDILRAELVARLREQVSAGERDPRREGDCEGRGVTRPPTRPGPGACARAGGPAL